MIIGERAQLQELSSINATLARCRVNVVRVLARRKSGNPTMVCCGFLVTPQVVVAPGFADMPDDAEMILQLAPDGDVIWEGAAEPERERLGTVNTHNYNGPAVAVLSFARSVDLPAGASPAPELLTWSFTARLPGDLVTIPQFIGNAPAFIANAKALQVSFGRIVQVRDTLIDYDADTMPGSSGSPVLDASGHIIGMHIAGGGTPDRRVNTAVSRRAILDALASSRHWESIRERHRLADVKAATATVASASVAQASGSVSPRFPSVPRPSAPPPTGAVPPPGAPPPPSTAAAAGPDEVLVACALQSNVRADALSERDREQLKPLVVDTKAERWTMRAADRARLISTVGSLPALKAVHDRLPRDTADPVNAAVAWVLAGPPYDLGKEDEIRLAALIQVVRWFETVEPALPTPAQVAAALERKRLRSRLHAIAGPDFRGRTEELRQLQTWWEQEQGPLSLTGIGGVGKSSLVARFASSLPADTLLLWLDFDRADLAPDDARSVLSLMRRQAEVQLPSLGAPPPDEDWEAAAANLGRQLERALPAAAAALLVLDSFEAAQYAERYQELWPVLGEVAGHFPRLRLIVTGRAPVPGLQLAGKAARSIHLAGLRRDEAAEWLQEHGVREPALLDRVLDLADGVPLILRLVEQFVERGGTAGDLPERLTSTVISGFLYDRILDRVQNQELKPLARAALVVRRLTQDMVKPVFEGIVEFPEGEIAAWFAELGREMALVEGTDILRLRPEVRSAALLWLQKDQPELVRQVDERAARWYLTQDVNDPEIAAEIVYHRLRLGDISGAEDAWRDGCGRFLMGAADDLVSPALEWLTARPGAGADEAPQSPQAYEQNAAERIRSARSRSNRRAAKGILNERPRGERPRGSPDDSPLVFQEAYELWLSGDRQAAERVLDAAGDVPGRVGRDRRALRALLLRESGDHGSADQLLEEIQNPQLWIDQPASGVCSAGVWAARLRLFVDVDAECDVLSDDGALSHLGGRVSPLDVVLPALRDRLIVARTVDTAATVRQLEILDADAIRDTVNLVRHNSSPGEPAVGSASPGGKAVAAHPLSIHLSWLGSRRWELATTGFLKRAHEMAAAATEHAIPLGLGVAGTLALFAADLGPFDYHADGSSRYEVLRFVSDRVPLSDLIARFARLVNFGIAEERWRRILRPLSAGVDPRYPWEEQVRADSSPASDRATVVFVGDLGRLSPSRRAAAVYLLSPDPLEQLVRSLAGDIKVAL